MSDTTGKMQGQHDYPQAEEKHPAKYERDLNPDHMAGQNIGPPGVESDRGNNARDHKEAHRILHGLLDDEELREVAIVAAGARLQQGGTYVDLRDETRTPFTATGQMEAGPENIYVAKAEVPYPLWNRIIGVTEPARLDLQPPPG